MVHPSWSPFCALCRVGDSSPLVLSLPDRSEAVDVVGRERRSWPWHSGLQLQIQGFFGLNFKCFKFKTRF